MKILIVILTLVLVMSMSIGICPGSAAETENFAREDAIKLFEQARECFNILQDSIPYYTDNEETEYFDYSVYKRGKDFNGITYFMVNKNHQYGTLEKTTSWAEDIFVRNLADHYVKNVIFDNRVYENENYLYDKNGYLWKRIIGRQSGLPLKYNVLSFRCDGNYAVLTVESRKKFSIPAKMVANTVKFEKTDAGWRVAESGYFNYYLGIAPPDGSPETGDVTVARAAVFAAGAVLAAAVPALILTAKRRRKEK